MPTNTLDPRAGRLDLYVHPGNPIALTAAFDSDLTGHNAQRVGGQMILGVNSANAMALSANSSAYGSIEATLNENLSASAKDHVLTIQMGTAAAAAECVLRQASITAQRKL